MSIIDQNLDSSVRKELQTVVIGALATGVSSILAVVPYNAILQGVNVAAFGLSGAPVHSLSVYRNAGGLTSVGLGLTLTVQTFGTSGAIGYSIAPPGVSLLAGDLLVQLSGVANTAITGEVLGLVWRSLDDVRVYTNSIVG